MSTEHLVRLFRHNLWANRLLLAACRDLTPEQLATRVEGTYGSLGATLAHLVSAEAGYVWRFDQNPDRFSWDDEDPVPPVSDLAAVIEHTGSRFVELSATTPDDRELVYTTDVEHRWPAWVVLGQVIDHGREHRSHAATILTQIGIQPPDMDMWEYATAVSGGQAD